MDSDQHLTNLADVDSIVFGLHKLWCICREIVSVQELLSTGFIFLLQKNNIITPYISISSFVQISSIQFGATQTRHLKKNTLNRQIQFNGQLDI